MISELLILNLVRDILCHIFVSQKQEKINIQNYYTNSKSILDFEFFY